MSDRMSDTECQIDRLTEYMSYGMRKQMPDRMPKYMPSRMPKYMSDRLPENI